MTEARKAEKAKDTPKRALCHTGPYRAEPATPCQFMPRLKPPRLTCRALP